MSLHAARGAIRQTVPAIRRRKGGEPLVVLTAATAPFAGILDAHADILLVGDSLGMVLYGMDSTLGVSVEMMVAHGRAVRQAAQRALVVVDMPFASYQESPAQAYRAAARMMAGTGADAIKLEGGAVMAETVRFLVERGIPVMGHVGLMPQHVHSYGGYRYQGRDEAGYRAIVEDAQSIAAAGAFSLVLEGVTEPLAAEITRQLDIPTIGIGASPACDGQVLVTEDMAGLFKEFTPSFVQRFGDLAGELDRAAAAYAEAVRQRRFPEERHCFHPNNKSPAVPLKQSGA